VASDRSIGLIETRGLVPLTAGIEAMMKTADVQCVSVQRVSSGYFAAAVEGSIAAVRQALESGTQAVKQYGDLRSAQMYPRPHEVAAGVLENGTRAVLTSGGQRTEPALGEGQGGSGR
jgi:ethanolamine utilization protein EutM